MPKGQEKELSKTFGPQVSDAQKEKRDVSNILGILDGQPLKTNPFGANVTGDTSYKRSERISAALHLVTSHLPENEPLRIAVRGAGIELLTLILEMRAGFRTPASDKEQAVLATIRKSISFVRLLAVSGYVSTQNVNAVAEALDELGNLIVVSQRSVLSEQLNIAREDLMPQSLSEMYSKKEQFSRARFTRDRGGKSIKDITDKGDAATARTNQIMDMLRLGGILGIKDISANLPQYSEKMIQRELAELVRLNRVQKTGAKRWSRYQMVP